MSLSSQEQEIHACHICFDAKFRISFELDSGWSQLFEYCIGIPVASENAPHVLCEKCAIKLKDFAEFKKCCINSNIYWKGVSSKEVKCFAETYIPATEIKEEHKQCFEGDQSDHLYNDDDDDYDLYSSSVPIKTDNDKIIKDELASLATDDKKKNTKGDHCQEKFLETKYFKEISNEEHSKKLKKKVIKRIWQCNKCGREYRRKKVCVLRHIKVCYGLQNMHIKEQKHIKSKPKPPPPSTFHCGICSFASSEQDDVNQHFNEHFAKNDLECKLCVFIGRDFAEMTAHRYTHQDQHSNCRYRCMTCPKICWNLDSLKFHYRSVHLKKKGGLCSVCSKAFTRYKSLRKHERLHSCNKFICNFCGKKYLTRSDIIQHLKDHSDKSNYMCETCGRGFNRLRNMKMHIENIHTTSVPVKCTHCDRMFKNQNYLNDHLRKENRGKPFICDVCSKGYSTLHLLKTHMFWHTGEKPHTCDVCGSKYKAKGALKIHMRNHTGHKPYACLLCDKGFASSQQLKRHQSVHTGVRRVKCPHCDRTFHCKQQMAQHCGLRHKMPISVDL